MSKSSCKKSKEYYGTCSVTRAHFKKICINNEWTVSSFEEVYSGEKTGKVKKFFYNLICEDENENEYKKIVDRLISTFKLRVDDVVSLKTKEARFYADGLKIGLEELTDAICEIYFA